MGFASRIAVPGLFLVSLALVAQVNPTANLSGTVTDSSGAVIPGASIQVTEPSTGRKFETKSTSTGEFFIGNMPPGTYNVTVTVAGFQTGVYQAVQEVVGQTYDLKAVLQPGEVTSTVTVESGQQVLETSQSSVGLTITGKVITTVPTPSNSALYGLSLMSPDIQTIGGPRQSSADGLPGGSVNITYDGISAQWQPGKSGDPLFTMISPNIDAVSEFSISSAAGSAADTGQGAVQLKFVTPRGTNQFHGGVWEYFRNDDLNANYYFNNLAGLPRQTMRYDQFGGKIGGPIWKDKLFFFADLSVWLRPQATARTRTLLTPSAASGLYTYVPSTMPTVTPSWVSCNSGAGTCTANLLQMAAAYGGTGRVDPVIGSALSAIQSATKAPGVGLLAAPTLNEQNISFNNSGAYTQQMPDLRLDYNVTSNHSIEAEYHLTRFVLAPDILNGDDYTFPVAPFNTNQGGYYADRSLGAIAWRWNIKPTISNELRFGMQITPESFSPDLNLNVYPIASTNLGAIHLQPVFPSALGLTDPWIQVAPTRDNPAVGNLIDNLVWAKGQHSFSFGFNATREHYKDANFGSEFGTVNVGLSASDPVAAGFNATNLPGMSATDLNLAEQLYGLLAGSVTSYTGTVALNPTARNFQTGIPQIDQYHQTDFGIYFTDSWRLLPNFTLNYGLRWQYEGVPVDDLNQYYAVQGGLAGLYGISGVGNLFAPGVETGSNPTYVLDNGRPWYNNWYHGWAPSLGFAWQPSFDNSIAKMFLGSNSVFRAGYSISYSQEGLSNWVALNNPGFTGSQYTSATAPGSSIGAGQFAAGSLALGSLNIQSLAQTPTSFGQPFAADPTAGQSVNVADPNLHMPRVQSWSAGFQRSLGTNMALEVRYVGNHAVGLWEDENLNEVNIYENGFLSEFNSAVNNLNICEANVAACEAAQTAAGVPATALSAQNFGDFGLAGQKSLPIFTASFTGNRNAGAGASTQANSNFSSGAFLTPLVNGQAGSVATILSGAVASAYGPGGTNTGAQTVSSGIGYWQNLTHAGYPQNFWVVNPAATGGAYYLHNGFQSTYNALVVDFRRRPANGLTFDANYTLSHGLTDDWQRNGSDTIEDFVTLRDAGLMKGPSPYDIRDAVKVYMTYEFPFGPGRRWSSSGFMNAVFGGWQFNAFNRWQSGRPTLIFGGLGGTVNQYDGGVSLNGITTNQLQNELGVYKTPSPAPGAVWYVPQQLLGPGGTGVNTATMNACTTAGQFCDRIFLYGPSFWDCDWSIEKITRIKEHVTFDLRLEALNVFNTANFLWGDAYNSPGYSAGSSFFSTVSANLQNPAFGRIFTAYQDLDSTDNVGGRMLQLVARFNF